MGLSGVDSPISLTSYLLKRSMPHATGCTQCRQESCESGYYNLHRHLNKTILLHFSFLITHYSFKE